MKKLLKFFSSKIKYIVLLYVFIQFVLIFTHDIDYKSDALYYYTLAEKCLQHNEFYPSANNFYDDYLVAPLYIDITFLIIKIYNSPVAISLFNLLIILFQMFVIYKITLNLFSESAARIIVLLYILYLSTLGLVLQNYTEIFFVLLISYSIYFFTLNKNAFLILSGLFGGAAIAVRPIGWALILSIIILQVLFVKKHKKFLFNYFYFYSGVVLFILLFSLFTYSHLGKFEFTSTTGPINLLLGANDDATGGFNSTVLGKGKIGYIEHPESMTYLQKGDFYKERAFQWITENPGRWLLLAPMKLLHTFGWDDISLSALLGTTDTNFARVMRIVFTEFDVDKALPNTSSGYKIFYLSVLILHHLFYYFLLFAIISGIVKYLKYKERNQYINLIILFSVLAILMIMITVGAPRYKYPMFILSLPFAANYLISKLNISESLIE